MVPFNTWHIYIHSITSFIFYLLARLLVKIYNIIIYKQSDKSTTKYKSEPHNIYGYCISSNCLNHSLVFSGDVQALQVIGLIFISTKGGRGKRSPLSHRGYDDPGYLY